MKQKVFIFTKEQTNITDYADTLSFSELHVNCIACLDTKQFAASIGAQQYNPFDHIFVVKDVSEEEIHETLGKDDWLEVIINKELQLHIHTSDEGYTVDCYRYDENVNYYDVNSGDDFVTSCYVTAEDLDTKEVTNIEWDAYDEEYDEPVDLPTKVKVPASLDADEVVDYLSDKYGYCIKSFEIEGE